MKQSLYFFLFGFLFALLSPQLCAQEQNGTRARANKLFEEYQYAKAAEIYVKLADVPSPKFQDMDRLAECYQKMNRYEDAEIWYSRLVKDPECKPDDLYAYGEMLKANARYSEARKIFEEYLVKAESKKKVLISMAGCDSAGVWIANPTSHYIRNEQNINTELSEFSIFPVNDNMFCYAGEPSLKEESKKYGWTGNAFLRVFLAERTGDNVLKSAGTFKNDYSDPSYHIGPVSANKAGTLFFITRTYPGRKGSISIENKNLYRTQNMELYIQAKTLGKWQKPQSFVYNNVQEYSLGQAVLSNDEKVLYFVSNMPGGKGGTDIWYSEIQKDGTWGKCLNAGSNINTPGDEMFPAIGPDGTLYFSSNGYPGMGGLDIFYSKGTRYQWDKPVNMKYPVNSPNDDFSYILNSDGSTGYFSSNRPNGKGGDDIYSFQINQPEKIFRIEGVVRDKKTGVFLENADVVLYDENKNILAKQKSKPDGAFSFKLERRDYFRIRGSKNSYYPDTASMNGKDPATREVWRVALFLDPLLEVGKTYQLKNILYDFDKDNIRRDASVILDGLVKIMHENPTLKIELASHTDSRGSDKYNEDLSQRRAQSAVDYLVSRGIARDRMIAKGYGESRLLNKCDDGVECSEAEHQANRRTEFTVLSF